LIKNVIDESIKPESLPECAEKWQAICGGAAADRLGLDELSMTLHPCPDKKGCEKRFLRNAEKIAAHQ
jgi:hypothetical protein